MNNDPILSALLTDLWAIRSWCNNNSNKLPPASVVPYLAENHELLRCHIHQLYTTTTKAKRETIHSGHRELDESIISGNSGYTDALLDSVLLHASGLIKITDDDINMLIRPLEYVKYLPFSDTCQRFSLSLSPIRLPN